MMLAGVNFTSEQYWLSALVAALIDVGLVLFLFRRIRPGHFRQLRWALAGASAFFWGIFGTGLVWSFWDLYYRHFALGPAWLRWLAPLEIVPLYAAIGLALWWLASRLPGHPVVSFSLLGGLESVLEHVWGIYGLGILDKVPVVQGVSPTSVLVFAVFEYIFYWGTVLGLAVPLQRGWQWWRRSRQRPANAI